jgi:hypothetical protein
MAEILFDDRLEARDSSGKVRAVDDVPVVATVLVVERAEAPAGGALDAVRLWGRLSASSRRPDSRETKLTTTGAQGVCARLGV